MKRSRKQKLKQFEHQKGQCCWCLEPMELKMLTKEEWGHRADYPTIATWEHIIPVAKGGTNALSNLLLAHRRCNQERGDAIRMAPPFRPYSAQT